MKRKFLAWHPGNVVELELEYNVIIQVNGQEFKAENVKYSEGDLEIAAKKK